MNKLTLSALAVTVTAGSAFGATSIKSVGDLAQGVVNFRGGDLDSLSIGTLFGGESVNGDTSTSTDDIDGINGLPAGGNWDGGDDVYSLQWGGGDLTLDLFFSNADGDIDLILFDSADGSTTVATATSTSDDEQIVAAGLAAGKYWVAIDGWQGASNTYKLAVSPTPGAAAVFGLAGIAAAGRRRR